MKALAITFSLLLAVCTNLYGYELAIGSLFKNEASYLKEWIEYHSNAGVDHFWLYNNNSTDDWKTVLQPYMDKGLIEVKDWPTPPGQSYVAEQISAFKDALTLARGKAKRIALIDIDEFIVPMKGISIPDCLNTYFHDASAIYVNWRNFGTNGMYIPKGAPLIFKLTASSLSTHPENGTGKSIVKPESVDIPKVWYVHHFPLLPENFYVNGDGKRLPFRQLDLVTDAKYHGDTLRINHYVLRDERFYREVRVPRAVAGNGNLDVLAEHYRSYVKQKEYSIVRFIRKNFSHKARKMWEKDSLLQKK